MKFISLDSNEPNQTLQPTPSRVLPSLSHIKMLSKTASRALTRPRLSLSSLDGMPEIDPDDLQYQCCFCGKGVTKASEGGDPLDPCAIVLIGKWERPESEQGVQQFFCHVACFEEQAKHGCLERGVLDRASE